MTAVPRPRPPSQSTETAIERADASVTPVFALKKLVAQLQREQNKIQDLLSSLGFALRSFNNLNQFLELIPLVASRVTDADGAALVLFQPNGRVQLKRLHCPEGNGSGELRQAIETAMRQPLQVPLTAANLDRQIGRYLGKQVQLFGTPISIKNAERGRLYVFCRNPNYNWTESRQKLLRLVADQTGVAIENDELGAELRRKERLDRELEIGAEIQLRLLPRQCPAIPGVELAACCQTANRVGGDYYDFIPTHPNLVRQYSQEESLARYSQRESPARYSQRESLVRSPSASASGGRWGIVIGDVMGKGVPAGLIMTMTRGMLRAEALNGHSPAKILQHLNRVMYADLENSHRFVTLFYSEYDPATRILSYSNAAHNPPLLWRAATQTMTQLDALGMLVGLEADSEYCEEQVQLQPGDTILYYTDGLTDAANSQGDRFDEDNLVEAFEWACKNCSHAQAILKHLFDRVQQFIGSGNRNGDDMTLVVMTIEDRD